MGSFPQTRPSFTLLFWQVGCDKLGEVFKCRSGIFVFRIYMSLGNRRLAVSVHSQSANSCGFEHINAYEPSLLASCGISMLPWRF